MVDACNPSKNTFHYEKWKKTISNIFLTSSDEALALLVLYNELHHQWKADVKKMQKKSVFGEIENTTATQQGDKTQQNKKRKKSSKERKGFTDACSGSKEGWLMKGRTLHQDLCKKSTT